MANERTLPFAMREMAPDTAAAESGCPTVLQRFPKSVGTYQHASGLCLILSECDAHWS